MRRIDRDDDRLAAEPLGKLGDELRPRERRRVDRHLVGARAQQLLCVYHAAHAAADRERDREPLRDLSHNVEKRVASLERGGDVQEHELVRARVRVRLAELDGVPDVAELLEADALDDAPAGHVEAGDQTREGHEVSSTDAMKRAPAAPLFSGWNWTPVNDPERAIATTPSDAATAAGVSAAYECAK